MDLSGYLQAKVVVGLRLKRIILVIEVVIQIHWYHGFMMCYFNAIFAKDFPFITALMCFLAMA
jgi:hypothetical protein